MEKRIFDRHAWRVPCTFLLEGRCHQGFVTDASAGGFFLQTTLRIPEGTDIVATLQGDELPIQIIGNVARVRLPHRETFSVIQHGVGVKISAAPEAYYQLILALESKD